MQRSAVTPSAKLSVATAERVSTDLLTDTISNTVAAFRPQSAGSAKDDKDKGKKGKKGKGKDEPVRKPASQRPPQKPRPAETAANTGRGDDPEERQPGEEGGPAEQEEKVHDTLKSSNTSASSEMDRFSGDINKTYTLFKCMHPYFTHALHYVYSSSTLSSLSGR